MTMLEDLRANCLAEPDEWIVADHKRRVTRGELLAAVQRMAVRLAEGSRQVPVAVLTERSVESTVALLAVNWAGRPFVPLDAADSSERLRGVLARIGVCDVLDATEGQGAVAGLEVDGRSVIDLRDLPEGNSYGPMPMEDDDIEFVLFTSGSTGLPKGVARRVLQMAPVYQSWLHDESRSREPSALFAPLSFLAGFTTVMRACAGGRRTILIDPRQVGPNEIRDLLREHEINRLSLTPGLIRALEIGLGHRGLDWIEQIQIFGEAFSWTDVEASRRLAPNATIRSGYGASEALGTIARFELAPDEPIDRDQAPRSSVIDHDKVRFEFLDHERAELIIRDSVVDGYWNDPDLTASRFGIDPDGVRFWRSGDVVKVHADGTIEFRGRLDNMLKINGVLVEPAEIERAMIGVPGVRAAAVVGRPRRSGRQQLVGHVEADEGLEMNEIRSALCQRLPTYMIPPVVVRHDALPLSDRGKIDRLSLRDAEIVPWRSMTSHSSGDAMERSIIGVIISILDLPWLDESDDIWDHGCDSLDAIEIATALSDGFGVEIQPNDLLEFRSPSRIVTLLRNRATRRREAVVHLNRAIASGTRPLHLHFVAGAGGPAFQYQPLSLALGTDWSFTVYEQRGLHQRAWPDLTVEANARRHLRELKKEQPEGPYLIGGHSLGGLIAHRMASVLLDEGHDVNLVLLDTPRSGLGTNAVRSLIRPGSSTRRNPARVVRRSFQFLRAPVGHPDRYLLFFLIGTRLLRRYRTQPISVPLTFVFPSGSKTPDGWSDHAHLTTVEVAGDHLSMVLPPVVEETAESIRRSCSG